MRILRYREDWRAVVMVSAVFAVQMYLYCFGRSPIWMAVAVLVLLPIQQLERACIHYHHHKYVFVVEPLNRLYELMLFFGTGLSPYQFTLHHVLGHHRHYLDPVKDPLRWRRDDGSPMGLIEFLAIGTVNLYGYPLKHGRKYPELYRRFIRWMIISFALLAVLVALRPMHAAIVFLAPMFILMVDIIRLNLWQHVGLASNDDMTASRNIVGAVYNYITFNSGFHTAHHIEPSTHWSRLPAVHARIAERIPDNLILDLPARPSQTATP
jgi:beta-carotene hydroxylase